MYRVAGTRTVVYCRVSTDKQADRGVSLDAQRAKAKAYAELYDLDIVDVVIDAAASAKTLARPGLERALGMLKAGKSRGSVGGEARPAHAQRRGPWQTGRTVLRPRQGSAALGR